MSIHPRAYGFLALIALEFAISISCGTRDVEGVNKTQAPTPAPAIAKPLVPGISPNLSRSNLVPLCFVDNLGPVSDPAKQKSVQVSGDTTFGIRGWAVDGPKKVVAGAVDVVIDQTPYSAQYGSPRKDVAAHFNQPEYTNSGFELMIAPGQLPKGQHSVAIRVISSDKKSYYQGPVIQFAVN